MRVNSNNPVGKVAVAATLAGSLILAGAADLLRRLEGFSADPYLDSALVWTDCYGNTKGVDPKKPRSKAECEALLNSEVSRIAKLILQDNPSIPAGPLAASISFVYNVGDGAYRASTYRKYLRAGQWDPMCLQLHRWVYITLGGKKVKLKGLENRRAEEYKVCSGT